MQIIIAGIGIVGFLVISVLLGSLKMNGGVKAAIIAIAVLFVVYSLARIQPKESKSKKDS
jgi:hypothetical protein